MKKRLLLLPALLPGFFACHQEKPQSAVIKSPDYQKAESFFDRRPDSAFYYFNKVAGGSKDKLQIAMAYNGMAELQSDAGDYFGSQESLLTSLKFLNDRKNNNERCLTADYNELGMTSLSLNNYDLAIGFYDQALKFTNNTETKATVLNNQAYAFQKKKDYDRAIRLFQKAILLVPPNGKTYARILTNMAYTRWLKSPAYNAVPLLLKALEIRRREKDLWGQNASYAHLSDYYLTSKPDSALQYSKAMYAVARRVNSPDDQLEALQKLIRLGPSLDARRYFARYQELSDSVQGARNAAKNQFALIRYGAEKNKADNLRLQKDNTEKKYQLAIQNIILYSSVFLFIVVTILITYWYRKRKQQAIQENQRRLSGKIHNGLANGLYQLMQEVDNDHVLEKERIVQQLNVLYDRSRDLAHEQSQMPEGDFSEKISRLLTAFAGPATNVAIVGNDAGCWENIGVPVKFELEQILQEWMVNMKKHSGATNVAIRFERTDRQIDIHYTDNGIGMPAKILNGSGVTNTGNRIKLMGGTISFDTEVNKGVQLHLTLPLPKD
ncbi:MAG: ATP-binding protein [Sphingobacteriales bacterium]